MLAGKGLKKSFGVTVAVDDVNCSVEAGKITAVVGPSGSGKTTLLRMLSLIDHPEAGSVQLDGREYSFPLGADRIVPPWPRVTVVFQQLFLWPHLTLRENILLPAQRRGIGQSGQKLDELVTAFQMSEFIDRYPNETSHGQRQRAALARGLMLEPAYILLDEVTSALDVESIAAVIEHLTALRARGMGIFLITHLLGFARRSADHVLFLDSGRVLESGGKEILDRPTHPKLQRFIGLIERAN